MHRKSRLPQRRSLLHLLGMLVSAETVFTKHGQLPDNTASLRVVQGYNTNIRVWKTIL